MSDWGIIGHRWAVRRLQSAIARGQLAQSHLFVGPPNIGRAALALATARALLGRDARTCALVDQRRHPDLLWTAPPAEGETIKVEQVRELLHALTLAPVESAYRVAVVDDAHRMTESGKNALLKTLEEPNPAVVIILIAPSTEAMLPTIVSRCQVLNLRPLTIHDVEQALCARGIAPERAALIARLSRGRIGWALRATEDEAYLATRAAHLEDLRMLLTANRTRRFAYAEQLAQADYAQIVEVLEDWLLLWRDVLRATSKSSYIVNVDQCDWIAALSKALAPAQVAQVVRDISDTLRYLERNANPRLALDVLMLKLPQLAAALSSAPPGPDFAPQPDAVEP
jgi:DNA polymerase-3 subunit delta'